MCGRYTLIRLADFLRIFPWVDPPPHQSGPRYNFAPTQTTAVVIDAAGAPVVAPMRWGLVPAWSRNDAVASRMINARAETLSTKPSFARLLSTHRCLVPADGFYEWKRTGAKSKQPFLFFLTGHRPFAFAGLWDRWHDGRGKSLDTFTIVTTRPNELLAGVHDRMPVILDEPAARVWVDPATPAAKAAELLGPFPADRMDSYPVSPAVNNPRTDTPELILPHVQSAAAEVGQPMLFPNSD